MSKTGFPMPASPHRAAAMLLVALCLCRLSSAHAADVPLLHAIFQDHAVVQRGQPIRIGGRTRPGDAVEVAIAGRQVRSRADGNGDWRAVLPALSAGGPYTLTAISASGTKQIVDDVLVGDVWLCSGQSNMALQVHRTLDARAEIAAADNDRIRLFKVPQTDAAAPRPDFGARVAWTPTTPETVRDFSAACYYFARELQKTVDVPMGLIDASWGGSRIEAWMSGQALRTVGGFDAELDVLQRHGEDPAAAAAQWGVLWEGWWRRHAKDQPWDPAYRPDGAWRAAPHGLGAWEQWGEPGLAGYDGMMWYRTAVTLTAAQARQPAVLAIGTVDELDQTWVNGRSVGSTYGADQLREYALPPDLLHAGENIVVVNAVDTYRDGGLIGPASAQALRLADGTAVPLAGPWHYRPAPFDVHGMPPSAPWLSASGLSTLHNGMIAPLGTYALRGVLWYQGESNTGNAAGYRALLSGLRSDWRERFGRELPWLIVQLPNYGKPSIHPGESDWATLRAAQRQAVAEDRHSGLAVTIDIGDRYDIHPANKQELGRRLARAARHVIYGEALPPSGPAPVAVKRDSDAVTVTFDGISEGLVAYGADGPVGFELCGAAPGTCRYASAEIRGSDVILRAALAVPATRVRYGWADNPVVTLFDGSGLPAGPFELPVP